MAYTNTTPNFDLPQFLGGDKANWFDINTGFLKIDTQMHDNATDATDALAEASAANAKTTTLETQVTNLNNSLSSISSSLAQWLPLTLTNTSNVTSITSYSIYNPTIKLALLNFTAVANAVKDNKINLCTIPFPITDKVYYGGAYIDVEVGGTIIKSQQEILISNSVIGVFTPLTLENETFHVNLVISMS